MAAMEHAAGGQARRARQREQRTAREEPPPARPGLSLIRPDIEHRRQPADPFAVHADVILGELNSGWGGWFGITYDGWWWHASRKGRAGRPLRGLSPDDLITAMRGDLNADGIAPGDIL